MATTFPVMLIGFSAILIVKIGWPAIVGMLVLLLQIPISMKISHHNGTIVT